MVPILVDSKLVEFRKELKKSDSNDDYINKLSMISNLDININKMKEKNLYVRSYKTLFIRIIWNVIYYLFFRFSPLYLSAYRRFILRLLEQKLIQK